MERLLSCLVVMIGVGLSAGCDKPAAPPPPAPAAAPPPPPPPPPPAAAADAGTKPKMVAPTDGLSLADRMAKRQAEEKKLADQLAGEEKKRLLAYDKTKLAAHQQVFASITKVRAALAKAKSKEDVAKIQLAQQKTIDATGKKMVTIDPKGGQSNVVTDYDVMLDALSRGYPDALMGLVRRRQEGAGRGERRARQAQQEDRDLARRGQGVQEVVMAKRRRSAKGARGQAVRAAGGAGRTRRRIGPRAGARADPPRRPPGRRAQRRSSSVGWRRSWAR